mgnify:FL=1
MSPFYFLYSASISLIRFTFGVDPPPAKSHLSQISTRYFASSGPITLSPIHMICALLLFLDLSVEKGSWQTAARIPGILFAVMHIPIPVPHTRIPRSNSPEATASATTFATSGYKTTSPASSVPLLHYHPD